MKQEIARQEILERNNESLQTLLRVSQNLVEFLDVQRVLQAAVDGISQLFSLGTAAIYLLNDDVVRLSATYPPLPEGFPENLRIAKLSQHPFMRKAIFSGKTLLLEDALKENLSESERQVVVQRNMRTLLFVPLVADGQVLGSFIVGSIEEPVTISDFEVDLSTTMSNISAMAIKNAQLFESGRQYAARLETSIAQRNAAELERQLLQEKLFQTQKIEAIGQLASGVAHDFNNQLSGIFGYANILKNKLKNDEYVELIEKIIGIAKNAASLTNQLLTFSRKSRPLHQVVDLQQLIDDLSSMLKHTINNNIEIATSGVGDGLFTMGDPSQIQNALLNLSLNARDAMPKGGTLTLSISRISWNSESEIPASLEVNPGEFVKVSVSDTGTGISPETMSRLFEPFFTTKEPEKGTGLGLATVQSTMQQLKGGINVESQLEKGTTFHLYFPLCS